MNQEMITVQIMPKLDKLDKRSIKCVGVGVGDGYDFGSGYVDVDDDSVGSGHGDGYDFGSGYVDVDVDSSC